MNPKITKSVQYWIIYMTISMSLDSSVHQKTISNSSALLKLHSTTHPFNSKTHPEHEILPMLHTNSQSIIVYTLTHRDNTVDYYPTCMFTSVTAWKPTISQDQTLRAGQRLFCHVITKLFIKSIHCLQSNMILKCTQFQNHSPTKL